MFSVSCVSKHPLRQRQKTMTTRKVLTITTTQTKTKMKTKTKTKTTTKMKLKTRVKRDMYTNTMPKARYSRHLLCESSHATRS